MSKSNEIRVYNQSDKKNDACRGQERKVKQRLISKSYM